MENNKKESFSSDQNETKTGESLSGKSPERLCHAELTLPQIRGMVDYCKEKGCKNEYGAYEAFITDVPEQEKEKRVDLSCLEEMEIEGLSHFRDRGFEQIRYFAGEKKSDDEISPSVYGRLYISPAVEKIPALMRKIIERHYEDKKDLVCKVAQNGARNDRIVMYLTGDFGSEVDMLKKIQDDAPELFAGCGKNQLWCDIEGISNVYYGSEPSIKAFSYGEDRARIIGEIFALQKSGAINIDDDEELDEVFKLSCLERRVDPFNFGFYIDEEDAVGGAAGDVLFGYRDEEYRQEEEYHESRALVEDWLKKQADLAERSWLGNDVPEFGGGKAEKSPD